MIRWLLTFRVLHFEWIFVRKRGLHKSNKIHRNSEEIKHQNVCKSIKHLKVCKVFQLSVLFRVQLRYSLWVWNIIKSWSNFSQSISRNMKWGLYISNKVFSTNIVTIGSWLEVVQAVGWTILMSLTKLTLYGSTRNIKSETSTNFFERLTIELWI